jgi:DNA-directed RNA polymerase specialized sigma24 family protein
MHEHDVLAGRFEAHRTRLRTAACQTPGSASDAGDAVPEAWLRLTRTAPAPSRRRVCEMALLAP